MQKQPISFMIFSALAFFLVAGSCNSSTESNNHNSTNNTAETDSHSTDNPNSVTKQTGVTEDYVHTDRFVWQKPDMIIQMMGDLENKTVADIGAGKGFFALRMTPLAKKVIAIDVDRYFIKYLDSLKLYELPQKIQGRLETRFTQPDSPGLSTGEVDIVLIVNTFMYIENHVAYLEKLHDAIVPGGRIIIVDFKRKRTPIGPPNESRLAMHFVEEALYEAGYSNVLTNDTALDYQYIISAFKAPN